MTERRSPHGRYGGWSFPWAVPGVLPALPAVAAGGFHACALLTGGTAECWGENLFGQHGNGTTTNHSIPVAVSGLSGATAITAGYDYTCALLTGGTAECWGFNVSGQLGDGTTTNYSIPVAVKW